MKLPFQPEELARLRLRYHRAIDHVHYYPDQVAGREPNPADERAHNFDFFDGTRIIVSLERSATGKHFIMVSAWRNPASPITSQSGTRARTAQAEQAFRSISHETRPMDFLGYDPGPIWAIKHEGKEVKA